MIMCHPTSHELSHKVRVNQLRVQIDNSWLISIVLPAAAGQANYAALPARIHEQDAAVAESLDELGHSLPSCPLPDRGAQRERHTVANLVSSRSLGRSNCVAWRRCAPRSSLKANGLPACGRRPDPSLTANRRQVNLVVGDDLGGTRLRQLEIGGYVVGFALFV